jgi:hypothetical protein
MNAELETTWKEVTKDQFMVLPSIFLKGPTKAAKIST